MTNLTPHLHYATWLNTPTSALKPACIDVFKLAEVLPHGSGIDSDWTIVIAPNGNVMTFGSYHAMNEHGYTGWRDFRFTIKRCKRNSYHALKGPALGKYQVTKLKGHAYLETFVGGGDAKDYLYDCVSWALHEIGILAICSHLVESEEQARTFTVGAK